jgi:hypothetical protein
MKKIYMHQLELGGEYYDMDGRYLRYWGRLNRYIFINLGNIQQQVPSGECDFLFKGSDNKTIHLLFRSFQEFYVMKPPFKFGR